MPSLRIALPVLACALAVALAPGARAQTPTATPTGDEPGKALLVLDGSKSMNTDAGDGGTRLDAAKEASIKLLDAIPAGTELGLRIYGSRLAGVSRARACRDTRLAFPVGPTDRGDLRSTIEGLEGVGRTPIGRSLLATPDDLGPDGKRVVVLVSDGGDNCAPPDPCEAAREVSRRGLDLTVSVVGLQVSSDRVRRQLECIARAGGGSYVEAQDADELALQLQALFLRGLRAYEPAGRPVQGAADAPGAPTLGPGRYLQTLEPGQQTFYAVDVPAGNRLVVAPTFVTTPDAEGGGAARTTVYGPDRQPAGSASAGLSISGGFDRVQTPAVTTPVAGAGDAEAGRYVIQLDNGTSVGDAIPVELAIDVAPENAPVDFEGEAQQPPGSGGDGGAGGGDDGGGGGGGGLPVIAGVGVGGLLLGLALALALVPRRRA